MNKTLLNAIAKENMEEVIQLMVLPSLGFASGSVPYNVDLKKDAIDERNLTIRIEKFIDTMCEFDEFSIWVNRIIQLMDDNFFDYNIVEFLKDLSVDINDISSDYTYNFSDDCNLNRDIHYSLFIHDGEYYIIFSVHYGADARVGFGHNVCFKLTDVDYFYSAMKIEVYDHETDKEYYAWELEDIATYDEDLKEWVHNETGNILTLWSPANGI